MALTNEEESRMSKSKLMRLPNNTGNPPSNEKLCLSVAEAAELLGVGLSQMYTLTHCADFPKLKEGKRILIPRKRFVEWVNNTAGEVDT